MGRLKPYQGAILAANQMDEKISNIAGKLLALNHAIFLNRHITYLMSQVDRRFVDDIRRIQ